MLKEIEATVNADTLAEFKAWDEATEGGAKFLHVEIQGACINIAIPSLPQLTPAHISSCSF